MNVSLSPEIAEKIRRRMESGRYESEDEVIEHAFLALDAEDELLADLRAKIDAGVKELDEGLGAPLDLEDFLKRANARHEALASHAK